MLGHALKAIQNPEGAIEVRIPTYDHNGRISWELEAEEVDVVGQSIYSAKNPKMFILENQAKHRSKNKLGHFQYWKRNRTGG